MDLQSAHQTSGNNWSLAKFSAFLFFAIACGLLVGSLMLTPGARATNLENDLVVARPSIK